MADVESGQRAVLRTDLLQLGLMIIGIVGVAFPLALLSLARTGWPEPLLSFPVGERFGWSDVGALLVLVGLPHAVGSDVWAKLLSARDAATARRAALGAAICDGSEVSRRSAASTTTARWDRPPHATGSDEA